MRSLLSFVRLAVVVALAACSGGKTTQPDRPLDVLVTVTSGPANTLDKRIPITFDPGEASVWGVDLKVRNYDGTTRTKFTGPNAWLRLSFAPAGQIVEIETANGKNDPNVSGPNVRVTNGEIKGLKIKVIGAYGTTRMVAQDIGFTPAPISKVAVGAAACANGEDDDGNEYADFPHDPNCILLNDDSEAPFEAGFGTSQILYFEDPSIHEVQAGQNSPFLAKQVDLKAGEGHRLIVTFKSANGMYITDIDDPRGSTSMFVFTFSAPYGVRECDRLLRLSGNVADFFGGTQLGTPGWSVLPWISPQKTGPCLIPDFNVIDGNVVASLDATESLESSIVVVKNPTIGLNFGREKVLVVDNAPIPEPGKSNCDLNGDGIVGFNRNRGGFSELEKSCNDNCTADPDCTEWNNFVQFNQVKIKFAPADGTLFFSPSAIPGFDVLKFVGPNKLAEVRGVLTNFLGPQPPYTVEPRCVDDVILFGAAPATIKDSKSACVAGRIGIDVEGSN